MEFLFELVLEIIAAVLEAVSDNTAKRSSQKWLKGTAGVVILLFLLLSFAFFSHEGFIAVHIGYDLMLSNHI